MGDQKWGACKVWIISIPSKSIQIAQELRLLRSFLMNECSVDNVEMFRFEIKPVELKTSKQFTVQT